MVHISGIIASIFSIITAENCDLIRQSPVNIDTSSVIPGSASDLQWSAGYYENANTNTITLVNDGHSLKLTAKHSQPIELSGGNLNLSYKFQQLHFHWGDSDGKGSEHRIMGKAYPLEMHVVHSQSSRDDIDEYVVVGYFFKVSRKINKGLRNLLDAAITAAKSRNQPINVKPFPLSKLLFTGPFSYYTYQGSLTTPPYTESVTWIVATTELPISRRQLGVFRKAAQIDRGLLNNFRCLQNLNGRKITYIRR